MRDDRRPCIVNGKARAMFHGFYEREEPIAPSPMVGGHAGGQLKWIAALVELEDGNIMSVHPETIRFVDGGGFDSFKFPEIREENNRNEDRIYSKRKR